MNPGDVVLMRIPQAVPGKPKLRPALLLSTLPGPYQNVLICGITTQLQQLQPDWDELVRPGDGDLATSGLRQASAIRLSYLYAGNAAEIVGVIGKIDGARLLRLTQRLARYLHP